MGETSTQITKQIENERYALDQNIRELQARANQATDWRYQVRKKPLTLVSAAIVSGIVLGSLSASSGRRNHRPRISSQPQIMGANKRKITETMDRFTDAMIGVATAKVTDFVGQYLPGFREHFEKAQREHRPSTSVAA